MTSILKFILLLLSIAREARASPISTAHTLSVVTTAAFLSTGTAFPPSLINSPPRADFAQTFTLPSSDLESGALERNAQPPTSIGVDRAFLPTKDGPSIFIDLERYTEPIGLPIDQIDVLNSLDLAEDEGYGFLHLDSSERMTDLLSKISATPTPEHISSLINYLKECLIKTSPDIIVGNTYSSFYSTDTEIDGRIPVGKFHRDSILGSSEYLLNFWIVMSEEVNGRPLAFVKPSTVVSSGGFDMFASGTLKHDAKHEYIYVPGMKRWEMLLFRGSGMYHGSPVLSDDPEGKRSSLALAIEYDLA
jgi:hypothetical protein